MKPWWLGWTLQRQQVLKYNCTLWFPGNNKPDQRQLRVQKWKNKEIPGRSEESNQQPWSQIRSNPKGGKQMCRPSCKSNFHRDYECIQTGTIFRPNILAYKWRSINVGNSGQRELDHAVNSISKVRHSARRKRRRKETKSPSLTIWADQGCLIQERFLSSILEVFKQ